MTLCHTSCHYNDPGIPDTGRYIYEAWYSKFIDIYAVTFNDFGSIVELIKKGDTISAAQTMAQNSMVIEDYKQPLDSGAIWTIYKRSEQTLKITNIGDSRYTVFRDSIPDKGDFDYLHLTVLKEDSVNYIVTGVGRFYNDSRTHLLYSNLYDIHTGVYTDFVIDSCRAKMPQLGDMRSINVHLNAVNAFTNEVVQVVVEDGKIVESY